MPTTETVDPWKLRLERVRGKVDYDGLERVSSHRQWVKELQRPSPNPRARTRRRQRPFFVLSYGVHRVSPALINTIFAGDGHVVPIQDDGDYVKAGD